MQVKDIMRTPVTYSLRQESAQTAARRMWAMDCGALPVVDANGSPIGIVTDRDLLFTALHTDTPLDELPVKSAMSRNVLSCNESDQLRDVEDMMCRHQIRRIPVVDAQGSLTGIISLGDLARMRREGDPARDPRLVATILEAVVRPTPKSPVT